MKNITIFQLVLLVIFGVFIIAGVIAMAVFSSHGVSQQAKAAKVVVWGTLDQSIMSQVIASASLPSQVQVSYVQKASATFDSDLLNAIASGVGPDIVVIPQDSLATDLPRIAVIPYQYYSARDFQNAFVEESQMLLTPSGVIGLPLAIDPLVMYWNQDIFSKAGLANPPQYWDQVFSLAQQLTQRDASGAITQSGVALGTYDNIDHAKDILAALFLQGGDSIATWNQKYTSVTATLANGTTPPANVLTFYTQFSNGQKSVYSWNQALSGSKSLFLSNQLAIYFGLASDAADIRAKSPNLNFDVAPFPQNRDSSVTATFGRLYVVAALKGRLASPTLTVMKALTSAPAVAAYSKATGLPPVRRDVSVPSSSSLAPVFARAALIARGWLDPNPTASDGIFRDMVQSVTSGIASPQAAIQTAQQQLQYAAPQ